MSHYGIAEKYPTSKGKWHAGFTRFTFVVC